ncbi:MAG: DUF1653 domain-containing protein [bacterium]|nr:DUF1653 domain-containing protein [bacterium]
MIEHVSIPMGKYEHFKGGLCEVVNIAFHSETKEKMVVYEHNGQMWVRPLAMFTEMVEVDGKRVPRFKKV